jgi:hypothetical protein
VEEFLAILMDAYLRPRSQGFRDQTASKLLMVMLLNLEAEARHLAEGVQREPQLASFYRGYWAGHVQSMHSVYEALHEDPFWRGIFIESDSLHRAIRAIEDKHLAGAPEVCEVGEKKD